jgi:hypothetical protein
MTVVAAYVPLGYSSRESGLEGPPTDSAVIDAVVGMVDGGLQYLIEGGEQPLVDLIDRAFRIDCRELVALRVVVD